MKYNNPYTKKVTVADPAVALDFDDIGFTPSYVKVMNVNNGAILEHVSGMADASALLLKKGSSDTYAPALVTENAITLTDRGFTLGVETSVNIATHVLYVIAI
jgi:hypothetical protein